MKILMVRHGDPDYVNDSLTDKGFKEAELLSNKLKMLKIDAVYCSPMGRAKATMEPTLRKLKINATICDWLREFPASLPDDKTGNRMALWDLMPSFWTKEERFYSVNDWFNAEIMRRARVPKEFENLSEVYKSITDEFDMLLAKHGYIREGNFFNVKKENDDTIVIFCHFGLECVLLGHLLGISPVVLWHSFVALPSSVTTLITEEREKGIAYFRCNGFGDISHLYINNEPPSFAGRFCETYSNMEERH